MWNQTAKKVHDNVHDVSKEKNLHIRYTLGPIWAVDSAMVLSLQIEINTVMYRPVQANVDPFRE